MWKLHRYKEAENYEVEKWLEKELDLTPYQKSKLTSEEMVRFSKFTFLVQRNMKKPNFFWRLSSVLYIIFNILLFIGLPFTYLFTGSIGYNMSFYDKYISPWRSKIGF